MRRLTVSRKSRRSALIIGLSVILAGCGAGGDGPGPDIIPITSNGDFEDVTYHADQYSDLNGFRPDPWGAEIWTGDPTFLIDDSVKRTGNHSVRLSGDSPDDVIVLAVPTYEDKPDIDVGQAYTLEAWLKLDNVQGSGVRLIQQFFSSYIWYPEYAFYGDFLQGSRDWSRVTLDAVTTDPDNLKGDPVVQLWGAGTVWIDDVRLYPDPSL